MRIPALQGAHSQVVAAVAIRGSIIRRVSAAVPVFFQVESYLLLSIECLRITNVRRAAADIIIYIGRIRNSIGTEAAVIAAEIILDRCAAHAAVVRVHIRVGSGIEASRAEGCIAFPVCNQSRGGAGAFLNGQLRQYRVMPAGGMMAA